MVEIQSFKRMILRAVLRQVSPMVIRLVSVSDPMQLPDFHDVFRTILGWRGDLGLCVVRTELWIPATLVSVFLQSHVYGCAPFTRHGPGAGAADRVPVQCIVSMAGPISADQSAERSVRDPPHYWRRMARPVRSPLSNYTSYQAKVGLYAAARQA
jgi:hypothetical protein